MPAFTRTTVLPSPLGSQETPRRGWNIFQSEGIVPSEGKGNVPNELVTVLP